MNVAQEYHPYANSNIFFKYNNLQFQIILSYLYY